MENIPDKVDFDGYSFYDIADTLKQYFRELPEPLLTTKLADTFISIHKGGYYCLLSSISQLGGPRGITSSPFTPPA